MWLNNKLKLNWNYSGKISLIFPLLYPVSNLSSFRDSTILLLKHFKQSSSFLQESRGYSIFSVVAILIVIFLPSLHAVEDIPTPVISKAQVAPVLNQYGTVISHSLGNSILYLRLNYKFILGGSNNESLCPEQDYIESKSFSNRATRLACSVTKPNLARQSE